MGNKCCGGTAVPTDGGDLPIVSTLGIKDPVKKFEMQYPFYRMAVHKWATMVHMKLGNEKFPIEKLKDELYGKKIWDGKLEEGQEVYNIIMKLPGNEDGLIDP